MVRIRRLLPARPDRRRPDGRRPKVRAGKRAQDARRFGQARLVQERSPALVLLRAVDDGARRGRAEHEGD